MEPSNDPAEVGDDKSSGDRSSPASSVHSNSSHSNHSLRIVSDDQSSQGSVSRKHMLLNQYRKEQSIKNENIHESESEVFQTAHSVTEASFSDNSCSGRYAIDPSSSSESESAESETSNKKIKRVSSSDDDSSSEEAATNKDVDDDKSSSTDTEVPQPPDELELKQLKRLETMKESPA